MGNETADRAGLLRRLGAAVGSGAAGLLLVTGCSAGIQAQTVQQTPSIDGVQAEAGDIAIRAAGVAAPESGASYSKGSSVPLRMVLVNRGAKADKLVSVTSTLATGTRFGEGSGASSAASGSSGSSAGGSASATSSSVGPTASASASSSPSGAGSASASSSPSGSASVSTSPSGSGSAPASSSPSGSASASSSPSGSGSASGSASASSQNTPIDLPGRQSVQIGISDGGPTVTLNGVNVELFPAQLVPVTLTFQSGASVTVMMAVQLSREVPSAPVVSEATHPLGEGESSQAEGNEASQSAGESSPSASESSKAPGD